MNTNLVFESIALLNSNYLPHILSRLDKEEKCGTVTVNVNVFELDILKKLVSDRLGELHQEWYDTTHDETYTDKRELAYSLAQTEAHDRQVGKLLDKLNKVKEV